MQKVVIFGALTALFFLFTPATRAQDADEVAKLKKQSGQNLLIYGSAALVNALMPRNLIDVYRLMVYPLVLGSGERFFKDSGGRTTLALSDAKTTTTGVAVLTYVPAARNAKGAR